MHHFEVWDLGFNEMHGTVIFNEAVAMETACILLVQCHQIIFQIIYIVFNIGECLLYSCVVFIDIIII